MKRWRHFLVTLLTIPFLIIYIWFALIVVDFLTGYYFIVDCIIYVAMGLLWLLPASIIIKWLANHEAH